MEYYLDPFDPNIKKLPKNALETNLDRGIVSYEFSDNTIQDSYVPITLTLEKNNDITGEIVTGIFDILKEIVSKSLNTTVDTIQVLEKDNYYVFNPITIYDTSVYENSKYLTDFYSSVKLKDFVGYTLLSNSPLTRFILDKWVKNGEYILEEMGIKYFPVQQEQISLIPLEKTEIIQRLDHYVSKLIKEGYFAYIFGIFDLDDIEIVRELCLLYNIEIIDSKDISTLILKTNLDFKISPETWIRKNLPLIKSGQFPVFSVTGNWMYSYEDLYRRKYSFAFRDAILKYIAYLAYARLSDEYNFIRPFTPLIEINEDLSIQVSLPSYDLVAKFRNYVEESLKIHHTYIVCKNLKEGVIKRWIIQNIDPDAYPMIFKDKTENEVLVHRSPLAIQYPSKFDFSLENMEKAEKELTEKMRNYYENVKICHDNIEAVTLENISELSLDELLNLVPITENDITYCFTSETVSKIDFNPLTRKPFSEETLFRSKYSDFGLRGLFNVGVLFGIYEDVPTKIDIPPKKGLPKITRVQTDEKMRQLVGNLFLVEIVFPDETTTPLFEISLPTIELEKIDRFKEYVDRLWDKGFFLNYWYSAVNLFLDLPSFPIIITDPVLLRAKDSIFDGNVALNYLNQFYYKTGIFH